MVDIVTKLVGQVTHEKRLALCHSWMIRKLPVIRFWPNRKKSLSGVWLSLTRFPLKMRMVMIILTMLALKTEKVEITLQVMPHE